MLTLNKKINVCELKPEDYKNNAQIIERYFRVDNRHLDRIHIPQLTAVEYASELSRYDINSISEQNRKFETATDYFKKKMAISRLARDLGTSVNKLDISTYSWNEDYYVYHDLWFSIMYSENKFMENNDERPDSHTNYVKLDGHQKTLDMQLFDELYNLCVSAIKNRKAMLLCKIEQCLSTLLAVIEQTNGFSMNTSVSMLESLKSYKRFFEDLTKDEKTKRFIKYNSDINVYGLDDNTACDYRDTYVSLIRKLTQVTSEDKSNIEYITNLIHNELCPLELEIIDRVYDDITITHSYIEELEDQE